MNEKINNILFDIKRTDRLICSPAKNINKILSFNSILYKSLDNGDYFDKDTYMNMQTAWGTNIYSIESLLMNTKNGYFAEAYNILLSFFDPYKEQFIAPRKINYFDFTLREMGIRAIYLKANTYYKTKNISDIISALYYMHHYSIIYNMELEFCYNEYIKYYMLKNNLIPEINIDNKIKSTYTHLTEDEINEINRCF